MPVKTWLPWKRQVTWTVTCHIKLLPDKVWKKSPRLVAFALMLKKLLTSKVAAGRIPPPPPPPPRLDRVKWRTQALYLEEEFSGRAQIPQRSREACSTPARGSRTRRLFLVEGETSSASFNTDVASTSSAAASGLLNRTFSTSSLFRSVIPSGRSNRGTPPPGVTQQLQQRPRKIFKKSVALCKQKILRGKIVLDEVINTHFVS